MSKPSYVVYTKDFANMVCRRLERENKKKDKEIKRLGNELQVQIEDNVRLNEYIEEKDREIERLKERLSLYESDNDTVVMSIEKWNEIQEEIERLQRQKEELQVNGLRQETLFKLEIERLNNKVEELMTLYTTERYVKEDYKTIIKEVREYIKNVPLQKGTEAYSIGILEILDKENK